VRAGFEETESLKEKPQRRKAAEGEGVRGLARLAGFPCSMWIAREEGRGESRLAQRGALEEKGAPS